MTEKILPAAMRASDADRDAVLADLSEHFQAGRLTAGELDERTGQALAARTWGELRELLADLPPTQVPAGASSGGRLLPSSGRAALPVTAVLVDVAHGNWGFIWLLLPALLIARRLTCYRGTAE